MPQSTEKGFMTKEVTRRQFMKLSGKCLAGLALSTTMLNVLGTTQAEVDSGAVTTFALAQGLLVVNTDPGQRRLRIQRHVARQGNQKSVCQPQRPGTVHGGQVDLLSRHLQTVRGSGLREGLPHEGDLRG